MVAPSSILFYVGPLILLVLAGAVVGAGIGWVASLAFRTGARGLGLDAVLGVVGLLAGFLVALALPWTGCYVSSGWTLCNQFPYVWQLAWMTATLLPILHQTYRFKLGHPGRTPADRLS